ncbi:cysteate synthase, partial [Methanococcoides sp. SA1]|nr:cysteate synthase [Methanococcoides sp. SA1]
EADEARKLFEENEGIDMLPAPAIACAAIMKALEKGEIKTDESIVLNITGGGQKRLEEELPTRQLSVDLAVSPDDMDAENKILEKVAELLKNRGIE